MKYLRSFYKLIFSLCLIIASLFICNHEVYAVNFTEHVYIDTYAGSNRVSGSGYTFSGTPRLNLGDYAFDAFTMPNVNANTFKDFDVTSYTNGLTVPLRTYPYSNTVANFEYDNQSVTYAASYYIYTSRLYNGPNTYFYISGHNQLEHAASQYINMTNDYDQVTIKGNTNGDKNATNVVYNYYKTLNYSWDVIYTRTGCNLTKNYNNVIGTVAAKNTSNQKWGTTTPLTVPTMNTYQLTYNLGCDDAYYYDSSEFPNNTKQNYKYVFKGFDATVTGQSPSSDAALNGVYAAKNGLSTYANSIISSAHATTVNYNRVYGTLTIPAIAKSGVNPDATACTFNAKYQRPEIKLSVPKRLGYTFDGWYLNADYSGPKYIDSIPVSGINKNPQKELPALNFTLYAKWIPNQYYIEYEYNAPNAYDGHSRLDEIVHINKPNVGQVGNWATISNPTLKGYIFKGWGITGMSNDIYKNAGINESNYITLPKYVTQYYYSAGGNAAEGLDRVYKNLNSGGDANDSSMWPTVTFSCNKGYNPNDPEDPIIPSVPVDPDDPDNPNPVIPSQPDIPDYPGWVPVSYTVTIDPNMGEIDGSGSEIQFIMDYDTGFTLPTPEREGYVFKGWQVYSYTGDSDYDSWVSTNTNPMTAGDINRFLGDETVYNLCYSEGSTIKLVAIWAHDHDEPTIHDLLLDETNAYIYKNLNDPTENADYCYYINTNHLNFIEFTSGLQVKTSLKWYNVVDYEVALENAHGNISSAPNVNLTYTPHIDGVYTGITKNTDKFSLELYENAYGTGYPKVTMVCTWEDAYNKCDDYEKEVEYIGNKVTLIGDCEAPSIDNIEMLEDLAAIDLREVDEYIVELTARDDLNPSKDGREVVHPSGLIDNCYFKILNSDNYENLVLNKTNTTKSDGRIFTSAFESFDLAVRHDLEEGESDEYNNLFNGTCDYEYYFVDNVGNVYTNTDQTSVFNLSTTLESFTYKTNAVTETVTVTDHQGTRSENIPVFKKGESALLVVKTMGYADALKIQFPDEWYIDEDYPVYMYWGATDQYEDKKLEPITSHVFYMDVEGKSDATGYWTENFIFVLPLYADKSDLSKVVVSAYKGDSVSIDNGEIKVNHDGIIGDASLEVLDSSEYFKVTDESILDDYRDSIKQTYRPDRQ